jgi:hypothetical protein
MQVDQLRGEVLARPEDVGRGLGRDVGRGAGRTVDVHAVAVTLDEAVAGLLDESEGHVGPAGVEVYRPVRLPWRALILALHARHALRRSQPQIEQPDLADGAAAETALYARCWKVRFPSGLFAQPSSTSSSLRCPTNGPTARPTRETTSVHAAPGTVVIAATDTGSAARRSNTRGRA